jgi:hypothetical protein
VNRLLAIVIALGAASPALGWPAPAAQTAHPAVVRVTALERGGASLGSGVLVAVDQSHGLVITNWHVVRDSAGTILVSFPDGFTSGAVVLATDHTWDLAALAIWRPNVQPTPIATEPARPGDILTIAGYGADSYRAISGRCTEYLSPGGNNPAEIVEVNVAARQGDSGGPILNTRGEVAGVLFGANDSFLEGQYTMGSYCGRVRRFVASVGGDFQRLPVNSAMIARQPPPTQPAPPAAIAAAEPPPAWQPAPETPVSREAQPLPVYRETQPHLSGPPAVAAAAVPPRVDASSAPSRAEQIKTILAAIGVFALLFHAVRLIGAMAG